LAVLSGQMTAEDVVEFYHACESNGVEIWIDGGWAIDAVLGRQTRQHSDLDIAVNETNLAALLALFGEHDFCEKTGPEINGDWNRVFTRQSGAVIDVHIFWVDDDGRGVLGHDNSDNAYPSGSFDGNGAILGQSVRCVPPSILFEFKTGYESREKDLQDIKALSDAFGFIDPRT